MIGTGFSRALPSRRAWLASFALLVSAAATADGGGTDCGAARPIDTLDTETASAGLIANASNREGSIREASGRLLTKAIEEARSSTPPRRVIFKSIPDLSKKPTGDDAMCEQHWNTTREAPIVFDDRRFADTDELTAWIQDFTQGKGAEGKSLYEQCPGKCSPQYTWWIDPDASGLSVKPMAACGMPRDKDGNQYTLSTALTDICAE